MRDGELRFNCGSILPTTSCNDQRGGQVPWSSDEQVSSFGLKTQKNAGLFGCFALYFSGGLEI